MRKMFKRPAVPKKVRRELDERTTVKEYVGEISIKEDELKNAFKSKRRFERFVKKLTKQAKKIVDGRDE